MPAPWATHATKINGEAAVVALPLLATILGPD
jgi:hypothetical protein